MGAGFGFLIGSQMLGFDNLELRIQNAELCEGFGFLVNSQMLGFDNLEL